MVVLPHKHMGPLGRCCLQVETASGKAICTGAQPSPNGFLYCIPFSLALKPNAHPECVPRPCPPPTDWEGAVRKPARHGSVGTGPGQVRAGRQGGPVVIAGL